MQALSLTTGSSGPSRLLIPETGSIYLPTGRREGQGKEPTFIQVSNVPGTLHFIYSKQKSYEAAQGFPKSDVHANSLEDLVKMWALLQQVWGVEAENLHF